MESHADKRHCQNGKYKNSSHKSSNPSSHSAKKVLTKHTGSLEIIEGDASGLYSPDCEDSESGSRPTSQGFQRPWSRSSMGSVPPRSDSSLSRRLATPTKQISLQAVKRKDESAECFPPDVNLATLNLDKSYNRAWDFTSFEDEDSSRVSTPKFDSESDLYAPQHATQLRLPRPHENLEIDEQRDTSQEVDGAVAGFSSLSLEGAEGRLDGNYVVPSNEAAEEDEGDDNDDDDDDSSEEEERKAPNELLMEFVECLMKKDYKNAEKLCKMILLYEPTNPEALKFKPVIEEKLRLDAEAEAEEAESNEEEDEEEDDDDVEDDDDDDGDDDSSSDEDDSDESDEGEESVFRAMAEAVAANYYASREPERDQSRPHRPDSGIASDSER